MSGQSVKDSFLLIIVLIACCQMARVEARTVGCGGKPADVLFLLDASNSIWRPDFRRQLQFVKDIIDWFTIGHQKMRVGVITYSDYPQLQFHLHYYWTKDQLRAAIDNIRQIGGYHTITADALRYARQNVFGGRGDHIRSNVTKVVVVITDGLSDNRTATALEAERTKDAGIHVFAVGVGKNVDLEELDTIASRPSNYYTFLVDGYEGLSNIQELLAIKTCTVTDPPTTTTTTTTTTMTTPTTTNPSSKLTLTSTSLLNVSGGSTDKWTSREKLHGEGGDDGDQQKPVRTPVILQPPTFVPVSSETSSPAEFKANGDNNLVNGMNCSQIREGEQNEKHQGQKEKVDEEEKRPCSWNGNFTGKQKENGGSESGKNGSESGSEKDRQNGYWMYKEHGYWIGSRFIKTGNDTTDKNGQDLLGPMDPDETSSQRNTTEVDEDRTSEGSLNGGSKKDTSNNNHPIYHVHLSNGPSGVGGYWYFDEDLGYVWYRYIRPGVFELDLEITNEIKRKGVEPLESANREKEISAPPRQPFESNVNSSKNSDSQEHRSTVKSSQEISHFISTTQVPNGFWGKDERGQLFWHRYLAGGVIQKLYPVTNSINDKSQTDLSEHRTTVLSTISDRREDQRNGEAKQHSTETPTSATARTDTSSSANKSKSGNDDSYNVRQRTEEAEIDFRQFVNGKRVWFQYVAPNDLDENDEETRLANLKGSAGAVDVPLNMAGNDKDRTNAGRRTDWRYSEEKRRVWHSSSMQMNNGSVGTEEITLGTKDTDSNDSAAVRLDDNRGRELWNQLVNLTGTKPNYARFPAELKTRFGVLKDRLTGRPAEDLENKPEQFHESYWFYDNTGRRFQVIHRYNISTGDQSQQPFTGNTDLRLVDSNSLSEPLDKSFQWQHEETEDRKHHLPDADGKWEYEKYGSEYWIRVLSSSKHTPNVDNGRLQARPDISISSPKTNNHYDSVQKSPASAENNATEMLISESSHIVQNQKAAPKYNSLETPSKTESRVEKSRGRKPVLSGEEKKTRSRLSLGKGCRTRKPMDIIFTLNGNAVSKNHTAFMVRIARIVTERLQKPNTTEVQVKYYPEIQENFENQNALKMEGWDLSKIRKSTVDTLYRVSRILSTNAAERKRSGKRKSRKIIVFMTNGELVGKVPAKGRRISRDIELYIVGVGENLSQQYLEEVTKLSNHKKPQVFHLPVHHSLPILEELCSALCRP